MDYLAEHYLIIKALHLISVIAWMAGLFYLPRLFVYHSMEKPGSKTSQTFKVMEYKLLKLIMNPAMILTFIFGGLLMSIPGIVDWSLGWLHLKLMLVVGMSVFHMFLAKCRKQFDRDEFPYTEKFFRYANEVPTILMIAIVFLAVLRPF